MPLHMLNMGNQSYSSNEQKYLEYLDGTLDSYLVQIEQGARIKWLSEGEQGDCFFKFNRDSLLRMDAKGRAETNEILIRSGQRTPNEARSKDDYSPYTEGDSFFMTKNYSDVSKLDEEGGSDPNGII
jgi:HK97 family phage portal protein